MQLALEIGTLLKHYLNLNYNYTLIPSEQATDFILMQTLYKRSGGGERET